MNTPPETPPNRLSCVLLDRDGVINCDSPSYIKSADEWHPLPGAAEAIARLCGAGVAVAVCSNQSGVGRGLFDLETLAAIHNKMNNLLARHGATLQGIFVCPHHPDDGCRCRKPAPGLLVDALAHTGYRSSDAVFVGDSSTDLGAARSAGVAPVLVRTGNGRDTERQLNAGDARVFDDLPAVVDWVLNGCRLPTQ